MPQHPLVLTAYWGWRMMTVHSATKEVVVDTLPTRYTSFNPQTSTESSECTQPWTTKLRYSGVSD